MPPGRFCVYMEPRANLARSPAPVPLSAALRFGHSSIPNTETEVHNEGKQKSLHLQRKSKLPKKVADILCIICK